MVRILFLSSLLVILAAASTRAAAVWQSTFNTTPDGVVDVRNDNTFKAMIGATSAGRQTIVTMSRSVTPADKAGRPLDVTVGADSSFGALYLFRWSSLPTGSNNNVPAEELAGFISGSSEHSTRQFLGARFKHVRDALGNDLVYVGAGWASEGHTNIGELFQSKAANLGTTAASQDFKLAIGYDGATRVLTVALYTSTNNKLAQVQIGIDQMPSLGRPPTSTEVQSELTDLALTHLGWSDYFGSPLVAFQRTTWQVDSLTYYDDAVSPFTAVGPEPTGACCQLDASCAITTLFNCNYQWNGAGTNCASASCTAPLGSCCDPVGACTDTTITGCGFLWGGPGTSCATTTCEPFGACCRADGSCSEMITENGCAGTWQGSATQCANVDCEAALRGACCHSDGSCSVERVEDCTGGEWQGLSTDCGTAACTLSPLGACCQLDGTCELTRQADCCGAWQGEGTSCGAGTCSTVPSPVWLSTFDTGPDGVVDAWDTNGAKAMIGPNTGGHQIIVTSSNSGTADHDRAGRLLPTPAGAEDSFGALYKFRYIAYPLAPNPGVDVQEMAGFISPGTEASQMHSTRQMLAAAWQHSFSGGEYHASFGMRWAAAGHTYTGYKFSDINFGPRPPLGRNFLLAIGYHASTKIAFAGLYSAFDRNEIKLVGGDIRLFDNLGFAPDDPALIAELAALSLQYLGWSDFLGSPASDGITRTWSVDALAYFNTADGAFASVGVPSPYIGACCQPDGTCTDNTSLSDCAAAAGTLQGLGVTCDTVNCPLPPCNDPFADTDTDGDVDMDDFGVFQVCFSGEGGAYDVLACHCFDRDNSGDVDLDDFVAFRACASGSRVAANAACDDPPPP